MKIRISDLKAKAATRPEGYLQDVLSRGTVENDALIIDQKSYLDLLKLYNPAAASKPPSSKCCSSPPPNIKPLQQLKMPPLKTQVVNVAGAAARVMNNVVKGVNPMALDDIVEQRKAICNDCEYWSNGRCSLCGCYTKMKITLKSEQCPKQKWLAIN